jgi:hypothetical protein
MSYSRYHLVLGLPRLVRHFPPQRRPPTLPFFGHAAAARRMESCAPHRRRPLNEVIFFFENHLTK